VRRHQGPCSTYLLFAAGRVIVQVPKPVTETQACCRSAQVARHGGWLAEPGPPRAGAGRRHRCVGVAWEVPGCQAPVPCFALHFEVDCPPEAPIGGTL
jgi:hypothetical protein